MLAETSREDWNKRNKWDENPVEILVKPLNIYYNIKDHNGVTAQVAVSRENRCTGEMSELECSPVLMALKTNQMDRLLYGTPEFRMRQLEEAAENVRLRHKIPKCPMNYCGDC